MKKKTTDNASTPERRILTVDEARQYAAAAGFEGLALDTIVAIARAESSLDTRAVNFNHNVAGDITSIDKGVLQINTRWHPEVSESEAFDPAAAFVAGYKISHRGTYFDPWVTFKTGAYLRYMPAPNIA